MNRFCKFAVGALAASAAVSAQAGFPWEEIADEVIIGAPSILSTVDVAYRGLNFSGNETLTLNLYAMDGAPSPWTTPFATPGNLLFTQTIPLAAPNGIASFSDASGTINLPGTVGIGLVFGGIDYPSEAAGPALYDPPFTGSSYDDYFVRGYNGISDWALYLLDGNIPANFGVSIGNVYNNLQFPLPGNLFLSPIPEPGTWVAMIGFAAVAGSMAFRRSRGTK